MYIVYFEFNTVPGVVNSRYVEAENAKDAIAKFKSYMGISKITAFPVAEELLDSITTLPSVVLEESFQQETLAFQNECLLEALPTTLEKVLEKSKYASSPVKFIQVGDVYFLIKDGNTPSLENGKETTTIGVAFRGQVIRPSIYKLVEGAHVAI